MDRDPRQRMKAPPGGRPDREARVFLGIGSNIEPEKNVWGALETLSRTPGITLVGISTFYRTEPLSGPALPGRSGKGLLAARAADRPPTRIEGGTGPGGGDFLNGVIEIRARMDERQLEDALRRVEAGLGRVRDGGDAFGPRTLDLDLLLFLPCSGPPRESPPTVHPDVTHRPFVAWPLLELAPELILPPGGTSLRSVAERFDGPGGEAQTRFTLLLRSRFLP